MRCSALLAFILTCFSVACGHTQVQKQGVMLAESESDTTSSDAGTSPAPRQDETQDIIDRILEDEARAAQAIRDTLTSKDKSLSAWAAVYALMLGIQHDEERSSKALVRGAATEGPLLSALCWRWLATGRAGRLPRWKHSADTDPVVRIFAALALAKQGPLPRELRSVLGPPRGEPYGSDKGTESRERVELLLGLSAPFDAGPLALGIVYAEARRGEWSERNQGGEIVWVTQRLRDELVQITTSDDPIVRKRIERSPESRGSGFTELSQQLETALVQQSIQKIRVAAITGSPDLRVRALRALAVVASEPVSGDFGAAASAFEADDPVIRLEGARTFLLLSKRARAQEPL